MKEKKKGRSPTQRVWEDKILPHLPLIKNKASEWNIVEFAKYFKVTRNTFANWINKYPELKDIIQAGRVNKVELLESTILERALGIKPSVHTTTVKQRKFNPVTKKYEMVVTKETTLVKEEPDNNLMVYLLKVYGRSINDLRWIQDKNLDVNDGSQAEDNFRSFAEQMVDFLKDKRDEE